MELFSSKYYDDNNFHIYHGDGKSKNEYNGN